MPKGHATALGCTIRFLIVYSLLAVVQCSWRGQGLRARGMYFMVFRSSAVRWLPNLVIRIYGIFPAVSKG